MKMDKNISGISRQRLGMCEMMRKDTVQKLIWFGHMVRMDKNTKNDFGVVIWSTERHGYPKNHFQYKICYSREKASADLKLRQKWATGKHKENYCLTTVIDG